MSGGGTGFLAGHAAIASGACMAALIPEVGFTMKKFSSDITRRMQQQYIERAKPGSGGQSPYGLVLLGETAIPQDVEGYIDNPEYPDLGLDDGEKDAVRRFMGSSLLCRNDILNWEAFAENLKQPVGRSVGARIVRFLPLDIRGILERTTHFSDFYYKSLLFQALNNILRQEDFYDAAYLGGMRFTSELNEVAEVLDQLREMTATDQYTIKGPDIESLVQRLITIPVSYEAREIVNLIRIKSRDGRRDWRDIPRENMLLLQRLRRRLVELFNRLLLEAGFSNEIIARRSTMLQDRIHFEEAAVAELRSAALKIVRGVLSWDIRQLPDSENYWRYYRVFTSEPRHFIRAIAPSASSDIIFGQRLGKLAVDGAMAGYTDFMISQWLTEYVMVPLKLVALGKKRVPAKGAFWNSVLESTGQAPEMI